MKSPRKLSRRKELGAEVIYAALQYLNEIGHEASIQHVRAGVERLSRLMIGQRRL
jgi:hypothetical protein